MIDYQPPPDPLDALPSPSPDGSNSLASGPSTSAVTLSGVGGKAPENLPTQAPQDFIRWVNTALQSRLGLTKYSLIPAATKRDLIQKIWQDPTIQTSYATNHQRLDAGDVTSVAIMENQIQTVLQGQGNDPSAAIDYTNMLQAAGVPLTASEQAGLASSTQSVNAPIPKPFGSNVVSGYDFGAPMPKGGWSSKAPGQSYGWQTHNGVDYGTRAGDRIVSPFAGVAHVQIGVAGYGNYVTVTLDDGRKIGFGHVASGSVTDGSRVNPGDLIAIAGANVGSAQGSVTIVTWQDAQGNYMNPHAVLDPIFGGATFSSIGMPGAAGTGMPTVNPTLDREYPSIKGEWEKYYGTPPSPEDVYNVLAHGSSPQQWADYIRSQNSHLDGLNQGQYYDMRQMADQVSGKVLGHPATDGIVKDLYDQQLTTPTAVLNWYNIHGVTGIPPETYNKIYKGVQPIMNGVLNEPAGADPRDIKAIHDSQMQPKPGGFHPE